MKGIDVSENNGRVDWQAVADAGYEFAIIRLGYGNRHLDGQFYNNINGAIAAGLKVGVYYYDYGLDASDARSQAKYMLTVLADCGLMPKDIEMGVWYDMEDADGWKAQNGMPSRYTLTSMCRAFINECNQWGYDCGLYACLDWLENKIAVDQLPEETKIWAAQYASSCDYPGASIWQFTDNYIIDGQRFDANEVLE